MLDVFAWIYVKSLSPPVTIVSEEKLIPYNSVELEELSQGR